MFNYFKEKVVRRDKIKSLAPKPCVEVILKIVKCHFLLNINEFDG